MADVEPLSGLVAGGQIRQRRLAASAMRSPATEVAGWQTPAMLRQGASYRLPC